MSFSPIRLSVIVASVREGRFGPTVANWFLEQVENHPVKVDLIDLAEAGLPSVIRAEADPEVALFADRVATAEAFVIVTCEYNHGYPASLKQAMDLLQEEWYAKPVGFVSYGGVAGGLRAVEQLRQVCAELHMVSIRDTVSFHMAHGQFDEAGQPRQPELVNPAAKTMIDQLIWWAQALREAREARSYSV
jgi:NAD(P)H-dependent FMN reductase